MSTESHNSINPTEWNFDDLQQKIIKMAILFTMKEGCRDCSFIDTKANKHSAAAVIVGQSVREAIETFKPIPDFDQCPGPIEVIGRSGDGCLPKYKCGLLGAVVINS